MIGRGEKVNEIRELVIKELEEMKKEILKRASEDASADPLNEIWHFKEAKEKNEIIEKFIRWLKESEENRSFEGRVLDRIISVLCPPIICGE